VEDLCDVNQSVVRRNFVILLHTDWSVTLTGVFINAVLIGSSPPTPKATYPVYLQEALNSKNAIPAGRWQ